MRFINPSGEVALDAISNRGLAEVTNCINRDRPTRVQNRGVAFVGP